MSIIELAFNNDKTLLTCGTTNGFIIYDLAPEVQKHSHTDKNGGVGLVKILNRTNISIIVGGGDKPFEPENKLFLWDDVTKKNAAEIDLKEGIRNAQIVQNNIIVILEKQLCVFDFKGYFIASKATYSNEYGLCKISDHNNVLTVVTLGLKRGEIAIWKPRKEYYKTIEAHLNGIQSLAISDDGLLVATSSEIGTNIHIYSTTTGKLLYKFRRGTRSAIVYDIAFDKLGTHIVCCSENGTVHIFDLYKSNEISKNVKSMLSPITPYIPDILGSSYLNSEWSYLQINVENRSRMICGFDEVGVLHIATYDGEYFRISGTKFNNVKRSKLHTNNV